MPESSLVASSIQGAAVAEPRPAPELRRNASPPGRLARALLGIVVFVGLSSLLSLVVLPLRSLAARLTGRDDARRHLGNQRVIHRTLRFWVRLLDRTDVIRVRWEGLEKIAGPGPRLLVANHPTILDTCLLVAELPQADNVVEVHWAENPMLGGCVSHAGYLRRDDGPRVVAEAVARLAAGRTLLVFPEGTRSPAEGLGPFRRGAARIAMDGGVPLLPVTIHCDRAVLKKGERWYDVGDRPIEYVVRVGEPIDPARFLSGGESAGVAARKVTAGLRAHFEESLHHADA